MRNLKNLIEELAELVDQYDGQLNTEVRTAFKQKIDELTRGVDRADAAEMRQLAAEALEVLASLLSVITSVMTLLS